MYQIDKEKNRIKEISKKTFSELGFREREHLQEWIAYNPNVFGEELLIIQKEFANFDGTNENRTSFSTFYQELRVRIADDRENVRFRLESQNAVTESLQNNYDKLTKVDKDNEMIELMKYQAAYEANAKLITVIDEMLQTILGMKK